MKVNRQYGEDKITVGRLSGGRDKKNSASSRACF